MRLPTTLAAAALLGPLGCSAFALKHEPFTPDAAPVSEVRVADAGGDTTYVVRTDAYVLRARRRELLWGRAALDDAAWRYRWLFGAAPARVELSVDSSDVLPDAPGGAPPGAQRTASERRAARATSPLVARATDAWLRAQSRGDTAAAAPWWLEVGAAMLVADAAGRARAVLATSTARELVPLDELLAATRPAREVDRGALVAAEGASLLLFLRERDPALVTSLAGEPARGRRLPELLAASAALPHSLELLDGEWRKWLRRQPAGSPRRAAAAS